MAVKTATAAELLTAFVDPEIGDPLGADENRTSRVSRQKIAFSRRKQIVPDEHPGKNDYIDTKFVSFDQMMIETSKPRSRSKTYQNTAEPLDGFTDAPTVGKTVAPPASTSLRLKERERNDKPDMSDCQITKLRQILNVYLLT